MRAFLTKVFLLITLVFPLFSFALTEQKGIYISHNTMDNTRYIDYLIQQSKTSGINTFIIDFSKMSDRYRKNFEKVKQSGLHIVSRIVVFPDGANHDLMISKAHWNKIYDKVDQAITLGTNEIQLDYIRYKASNKPSRENSKFVLEVIRYFKERLASAKVPLQIDIFGEVSFYESPRIGQNVALFADFVDAINPMTYPSHYEPFKHHATQPYQTVLSSLQALHEQVGDKRKQFRLYPYIELSNYRYPLSEQQRYDYIRAQIKATEDGSADGWYAWSPSNRYDTLFAVLKKES